MDFDDHLAVLFFTNIENFLFIKQVFVFCFFLNFNLILNDFI